MKYSEGEIQRRIYEKRRKFIGIEITLVLGVAACIIAICSVKDDLMGFVFAVGAIVLGALFARTFKKYKPEILFCREFRGTNIRENEYVAMRYRGVGRVRHGTSVIVPRRGESAGSNQRPRGLRGTVYLRLENGNIEQVTDLPVRYTDFYEEGDSLVRYSGTRYPIVLNRKTDIQPCPICGRFNNSDQYSCLNCDLPIEKG